MNVVVGRIAEIYIEDGVAQAKVKVSGTYVRVPLTLILDARVGDKVLVGSGVAISRVDDDDDKAAVAIAEKGEADYVSGSAG